jgi:hypothetical protein
MMHPSNAATLTPFEQSLTSVLTLAITAAEAAVCGRRLCDDDPEKLEELTHAITRAHARPTDETRVTEWAALMVAPLRIYVSARRDYDTARAGKAARVLGVLLPDVRSDLAIALVQERGRR